MRNEYPRPNFVRKEWMNLNGVWSFIYGGRKTQIEVPYVCQSVMSGIGERIKEDHVVYERAFQVPDTWHGKQIMLNFGAVDYRCNVFVNENCVGSHTGGQTPFSFDITRYLNWKEERIRVEVEDPLKDECIPRGKQFWEDQSRFIWYTPSTGIWQTVWLEPVEKTSFEWVHFTPDIDEGTVEIDFQLSGNAKLPARVHIQIRLGEEEVFHGNMLCGMRRNTLTVDVFRKRAMEGAFHFTGNYWSPERPILYDVFMQVDREDTGVTSDEIVSYFGMRKIHVEEGKLYLNNQPYFQKLVLDQGYWQDSLVTAPSDQAYIDDIMKCKEMGFNGCRKHEKAEDPRFLYWADRLGFLVWGGMASFWSYTPQAAEAFTREWMDIIERDYNHPSIVVWGMLNESWGVTKIYSNVQQQSFARSLYYMAKALDSTRLIVSNDGWEMVESDICAVHSYMHGAREDLIQHQVFADALQDVEKFPMIVEKLPFVKGTEYAGQPVVLTECGGIALNAETGEHRTDGTEGKDWGYTSTSRDDFLSEYGRIIDAIYDSNLMNGFCYTQLSDVEQEMNGLLTRDHQYKFDPREIKRINERRK
ncbi:MAG: glycoside hydrolase family 2 [Lachnospiraceae bacterium]|nr:glycoside hydrolase family 2 [Lachnospiraceae bacterium]